MNNIDLNEWLSSTSTNLFVAKEYFHHHAYEILNTHSALKKDFLDSLNASITQNNILTV